MSYKHDNNHNRNIIINDMYGYPILHYPHQKNTSNAQNIGIPIFLSILLIVFSINQQICNQKNINY